MLLGGCGGSAGETAAAPGATPCPTITPGVDLSLIPEELPKSLLGDVVATNVDREFLIVDSFSTTQIVELDPMLQRDLLARGYHIVGHDNEGFEAEIFFAKRAGPTGVISLHHTRCTRGKTRVKMVYPSQKQIP